MLHFLLINGYVQDEEKSKQNEYFAGGLDQRGGGSGLAVLGPPSDPRRPGGSMFDAVVNRATQAGSSEPSSNSNDPSLQYRISMYRNGFTVNNGPLRDPEVPENRAFLMALMEGRIPDEIVRNVRATSSNPAASLEELDVQLEDKRQEDYRPPTPPAYVAFSGAGNSLGSVVRGGSYLFRSSMLAPLLASITIDEAASVTTVQVRTSSGKRLRIRVNVDMSVLQLAALILRDSGSLDTNQEITFTLSAGFPPQDISDPQQTVTEAGLLNAMITQKTV